MVEKWDPLLGINEIAELANVSRQAVVNWRSRFGDFPKPVSDLASGPVFNRSQITSWLSARKGPMGDLCPVCLRPAERGRDKDYGERKQVRCDRCGPFIITRTAIAMLGHRTDEDPLFRARLSHAIRSRTNDQDWLEVSSASLDLLGQEQLPSITRQVEMLVQWLGGRLGDDQLGLVQVPNWDLEVLAGVVGVADANRVQRLLEYASKQGVIELYVDGIGLSPAVGSSSSEQERASSRAIPSWIARLPDQTLRDVIQEVYHALASNSVMLASIGTRTLLDRAMELCVGDLPGGFAGKLNAMVAAGVIGQVERDVLEVITDAGNAAAHRGFAPTREMLTTILDVTENFLHRHFVLRNDADAVRRGTPPRRQNRQRRPL